MKDKPKLKGSYIIKKFNAKTGELIWQSPKIENLIVASTGRGLDIITRQLGGDTTYQIEIDSAKIGTGTTAPTIGDTDLGTAILSGIDVASAEFTDVGQVTLSFFIPDADLANGTYTEFGLFCNGRLFARSLISPNYTKSSNENTTIDYSINAE